MMNTPHPPAPAPARTRQHGAALLTAMIIVSLIATLSASMLWQQWRAVQVEVAERSQSQAREAALRDVTERLNKVEAHLMANVRKMPGRLG